MKINITTPIKNIVQDDADEVYAYGPRGEFGILPGHAHYVTPLEMGRLYYLKNGKKHSFVVYGGFLEVFQDNVSIFADQVEKAETIVFAEAKKHLESLEKKLAHENLEPEEFQNVLREEALERARVAATS